MRTSREPAAPDGRTLAAPFLVVAENGQQQQVGFHLRTATLIESMGFLIKARAIGKRHAACF
jgi:hypothetical protein